MAVTRFQYSRGGFFSLGRALVCLVLAARFSSLAWAQVVYEPWTFFSMAGSRSQAGATDGPAASALFSRPMGIAVDGARSVFVADATNHTIRKITADGTVSTFAGLAGKPGAADGTGSAARFKAPFGLASDSLGNLFVSDFGNYTIRKITPAGEVSTIAGLAGFPGTVDGVGDLARFGGTYFGPQGLTVTRDGYVYVADGQLIRRISPSGLVVTFAGKTNSDYAVDGVGLGASFLSPRGLCSDANGNVFVAESAGIIRKVTSEAVVTTLAGNPNVQGHSDNTNNHAYFNGPTGIAIDSAGNLYVTDSNNGAIRKVTSTGKVTTIAGGGARPSLDGAGAEASFRYPTAIVADAADNLFVAETDGDFNNVIRKSELPIGPPILRQIPASQTVAGNTPVFLSISAQGALPLTYQWFKDGKPIPGAIMNTLSDTNLRAPGVFMFRALVKNPEGEALSEPAAITVYPSYTFTTLAGGGGTGYADGPGGLARFRYVTALANDSTGNLFIGDVHNSLVRKLSPAGVVTTVAGLAGSRAVVDGLAGRAQFDWISALTFDSVGGLQVADGKFVRQVKMDGSLATLKSIAWYPHGMSYDSVGNLFVTAPSEVGKIQPDGANIYWVGDSSGTNDGVGNAAQFSLFLCGMAIDRQDNLYVADTLYSTIRKITPTRVVTTYAGTPGFGGALVDGVGNAARLYNPHGVAIDKAGNLFVADTGNNAVRRISPDRTVTTIAGQPTGGFLDATGSGAKFLNPGAISVLPSGEIFVADQGGTVIRKISAEGVVTTVAGRTVTSGFADGTIGAAQFDRPYGVAVDAAHNIYVGDTYNSVIRKISPSGAVSTLAGLHGATGAVDAKGEAARFNLPNGVAVDPDGNVFVADRLNHAIRKITPSGEVTTFAGQLASAGGSDGPAPNARFKLPLGIAIDLKRNLYVADQGNSAIRKITPGGQVTTLAGALDQPGSADGAGLEARFKSPFGIAVGRDGMVYVADSGNRTIRKITPEGVVTTLAGKAGETGSADGPGAVARFGTTVNGPCGIAVDAAGFVYVTDSYNATIRRISPEGLVMTVAGQAGQSAAFQNGTGPDARFNIPFGIAVDETGKVYVAEYGNNAIRTGYLQDYRVEITNLFLDRASGRSTITVSGPPEERVVLEATTNFLDWTPVQTNYFRLYPESKVQFEFSAPETNAFLRAIVP